jgi:peptidoglycan/LPS O-acetylase OafA/YrhL
MMSDDHPSRLAWLDSLRGVAILGVVLVHCGQRPLSHPLLAHLAAAGQYGVQLFFVISAITISLTYRRHVKKYGTTLKAVLAWLTRRVFRIWPLYASAAFFYSIERLFLSHWAPPPAADPDGWAILANLALVNAWIPSANGVVPGGWSIGVEATFYSAFPMLMIAWKRPYFPMMLMLLAAGLVTISEFANYESLGTFAITNNSFFYFWPPTQIPVILIGCAFFVIFLSEDSGVKRPNPWAAGVLFAIFSCVGLALGTWGNLFHGLAPSIFALAFCCLALVAASDRVGVIANRWMTRIGVCSYGIYLIHFAAIDLARLALKGLGLNKAVAGPLLLLAIYLSVLAISYSIAACARRLIELPGIELGKRLSFRLLSKSSPVRAQNFCDSPK